MGVVVRWVRQHRRRLAIWGGGGTLAVILLAQLFYPSSMLVPFAKIDGQAVGLQQKNEVIRSLDTQYKDMQIPLYFGTASQAYRTPKAAAIGLTTTNTARVEALDYSFWLRLVPSSLLWAHATQRVSGPKYAHNDATLTSYITKELGQSCDVAPKNATLAIKNTSIVTVSAEKGGTCKMDDIHTQLKKVSPRLQAQTRVTVPMDERSPKITDKQAKALQQQLSKRIENGLTVMANAEKVLVPRDQLLQWLVFENTDPAITVKISPEKSTKFITEQIAPKVTKAAGISKVATQDFTETSRVDGAPGQTINVETTLGNLGAYLTNGGDTPSVAVKAVAPRVEYTRSYSPTDTGLSALLKQYAESHPGTYGISLIELSGKHRRAAFQDTKQFRTASTYKLFVAYGTLKRVESGTWRWSDQIQGGRSLEKCFDDMIVKSDNPCGEALLAKIGYTTMTNELKAAGLTGSSFTGTEPVTTAGDLSTFNASLESGQLVSSESRARLLDAMKRNIYRQGIPAGANGTVANKVGFLDAYLHDAAVIYTANGPVVLSVMTSGSSWATIADLTRQIESLRSR